MDSRQQEYLLDYLGSNSTFALFPSQETQLRPIVNEVAIGVDVVRLGEVGLDQINDFAFKSKFDMLFFLSYVCASSSVFF